MSASKLDKSYTENDLQIELLKGSVSNIDKTLLRMEQRFDKIDQRFEKIDQRFDKIDERFDKLETKLNNKIDSNFKWTIGLIIVTILVPIVQKVFHL